MVKSDTSACAVRFGAEATCMLGVGVLRKVQAGSLGLPWEKPADHGF